VDDDGGGWAMEGGGFERRERPVEREEKRGR